MKDIWYFADEGKGRIRYAGAVPVNVNGNTVTDKLEVVKVLSVVEKYHRLKNLPYAETYSLVGGIIKQQFDDLLDVEQKRYTAWWEWKEKGDIKARGEYRKLTMESKTIKKYMIRSDLFDKYALQTGRVQHRAR